MIPIALAASSRRRNRSRSSSSRADTDPQGPPSLPFNQAKKAPPSCLYRGQSSLPPPRAVGSSEHEAAMAARDRLDARLRKSGCISHRLSSMSSPTSNYAAAPSAFSSRTSSTSSPISNYTPSPSAHAKAHVSSSLPQAASSPQRPAATFTSHGHRLRQKAPSSYVRANAIGFASRVHTTNCEGEGAMRSLSTGSSSGVTIRSDCKEATESLIGLESDGNSDLDDDLDDLDNCSICLESFSEHKHKSYFCLPCKHRFHTACLRAWLQKHYQCPNCRTRVPKAENLVQCIIPKEIVNGRNKGKA